MNYRQLLISKNRINNTIMAINLTYKDPNLGKESVDEEVPNDTIKFTLHHAGKTDKEVAKDRKE